MDTKTALLKALDSVVGVTEEEMQDNLDLDLFENEILDSLSLVTLLNEVEGMIGKKIAIKKLSPEAFSTVNRLAAAIDRQ